MTVFFPGMSTESLTDDEINEKLTQIRSRLAYAHNSWKDSYVIHQLQSFQDALLFELNHRSAVEYANYTGASKPKITNTDPEFNEKDAKVDKQNKNIKDEFSKKRVIPIITKKIITKDTPE